MMKKARRYAIAAAAEMQPTAGFFQLCGSPIRADTELSYGEDNNHDNNTGRRWPMTPTTPPINSSMRFPRTQASLTQLQFQFEEETTVAEEKGGVSEKKKAETLSLAKAQGAGLVMSNWAESRLPPMVDLGALSPLLATVSMEDLRLGKVLGSGAFGMVYAAMWKRRRVAVKILIRQNLSDDVVEEFETELRIMSYLNHPNICRLLGACLEPARRALIIELVEHGCLWHVLRKQHKTLHTSQRIKMIMDVARGMEYLHSFERPILHRDMKSPNLLVGANYSIKISDFGLARVKAQIQTMTGNCGTVQWMAPEVLSNCKYTEKADVYSFAIVMWEIFTGDCPYGDTLQITTAMSVLNQDLRPTIPSRVPKFFSRLMKTCWARDPEKRPSFTRVIRLYNKYYPEGAIHY